MPAVSADAIAAWCRAQLRARSVSELFRAGYLSLVVGLRMDDGRELVLKIRPPAPRLAGCVEAQRRLNESGFPCPRPLGEPATLEEFFATAETYIPGGDRYPTSGRSAGPFAALLARLVTTAPSADDIPSLAPNPPWAAWNHSQGGLWPWPDDRDIDLNLVDGPPWLDAAGASARRRLQGAPAREVVVGHGDWYTANIRWAGNESHAVHDWDSLISDRESVVAGLAAAVYPGVQPGSEATIEETEEFLDSYARARGRDFSAAELEESWAAGLWIRSFDAKKQFASDGRIGSLTHSEAKERMDRSGI